MPLGVFEHLHVQPFTISVFSFCHAVVGPQYCSPQKTVLVLQEQFGMMRDDDFHVTDTQGRTYFM